MCFISVLWHVLFCNCLADKEESLLLYFNCILSNIFLKCILSVFLYTQIQKRIQNAEKPHIKGRLLHQTVILYIYVRFQNGNFS